MKFSSQETEVLLGFIEWRLIQLKKLKQKLDLNQRDVPQRVLKDLQFWQRLKTKFQDPIP
jgi:hypothetical protein